MPIRASLAALMAGGLLSAPVAAQEAHPGEALYKRICFICHDTGVQIHGAKGAPRLGNQRAWESRARRGVDALADSVLSTRGGNFQMPTAGMSRDEVRDAVAYMLYMAERNLETENEVTEDEQTSMQ